MTTTLADRLLAAADGLSDAVVALIHETVATDPTAPMRRLSFTAARLAALTYAAAWHEVNGAGLRADEADALTRARADLAAMTKERDEATERHRLEADRVFAAGHAAERKTWQDATCCDTPADVKAKADRWEKVSRANLESIDGHRKRVEMAEREVEHLRDRAEKADADLATERKSWQEASNNGCDKPNDLRGFLEGARIGLRVAKERAEAAEAVRDAANAQLGEAEQAWRAERATLTARAEAAEREVARLGLTRVLHADSPIETKRTGWWKAEDGRWHIAVGAVSLCVGTRAFSAYFARKHFYTSTATDERDVLVVRAEADAWLTAMRDSLAAHGRAASPPPDASGPASDAELTALWSQTGGSVTASNRALYNHGVAYGRARSAPPPEAVRWAGAPERCPACGWCNTNLINYGRVGEPRWMCHGCAVRALDKASASPPPDASDEEMARALYAATAVPGAYDDLPWSVTEDRQRAGWIAAVTVVVRPRLDALRAEVDRLTTALAAAEEACVLHEKARDVAQGERDDARREIEQFKLWSRAFDAGFLGHDDAEVDAASAVAGSMAALWFGRGMRLRAAREMGPPTPSPRFVAVRRDEVNGRPASWFHTEAEAGRYVALCNDNPDLFGADDEIEGELESYTHAVVDTGATPPAKTPRAVCPTHGDTVTCTCTTGAPHCHACGYTPPFCDACDDHHDKGAACATPPAALPQVEAFDLPVPALEWLRDGGYDEDTFDSRTVIGDGTGPRGSGCELHAQIYRDGSWDMTLTMPSAGSAEKSKARVEAAVAVLTGRAEVRR